jgi:hypothetical protein
MLKKAERGEYKASDKLTLNPITYVIFLLDSQKPEVCNEKRANNQSIVLVDLIVTTQEYARALAHIYC